MSKIHALVALDDKGKWHLLADPTDGTEYDLKRIGNQLQSDGGKTKVGTANKQFVEAYVLTKFGCIWKRDNLKLVDIKEVEVEAGE